jgi:hypothetical protein
MLRHENLGIGTCRRNSRQVCQRFHRSTARESDMPGDWMGLENGPETIVTFQKEIEMPTQLSGTAQIVLFCGHC